MTKELLDKTAQRVMKRMLLSGSHHYEQTVVIREDGGISDELMQLEIAVFSNGNGEACYKLRSKHASKEIPTRVFAQLYYHCVDNEIYLDDCFRGSAFTYIDEERASRFSEF